MSLVGAMADGIKDLIDYFRRPSPVDNMIAAIEDLYREANEAHALAISDWTLRFEAWCREEGIHYNKSDKASLDCPCRECKRRVLHEAYMISRGYRRDGANRWMHNINRDIVYDDFSFAQYDPDSECKRCKGVGRVCHQCGTVGGCKKCFTPGNITTRCAECFPAYDDDLSKKLLTIESKVDTINRRLLNPWPMDGKEFIDVRP